MSVIGDLSQLAYSSSSATGFTNFAGIENIIHPKAVSPEIKNSKLDTPAETSQPGIPDYGELSFKLRYNSSVTSLIRGWQNNKTIMWFKVTPNDPTLSNQATDVVNAWVKEFQPIGELALTKEVIADCVLKVTGAATFTAGS